MSDATSTWLAILTIVAAGVAGLIVRCWRHWPRLRDHRPHNDTMWQ